LRYVPDPEIWDEAIASPGVPRRHWRQLAVALRRLGADQLSRRWQVGQQLIRSNGITYNVYGDPHGMERPWVMDPLPLVIDDKEWDGIAAAITQRATLLNSILADLYGERQLIHRRALPPELLFANPNFLRPCTGIVPPQGIHLHNYAADLARSGDGKWWVIADRTQAPSGIGYALENRMVSARTLPSVFNQCHVRQLATFFEASRDALLELAPNGKSNPRMVLLTPGPNNETFFEHSFLARHWGIPLVEGADLTVRDNRVFLKTLAGLEPIDIVLRRMDDNFCDPLELRGDSLLGIPSFTQAVRSGNVVVANALGSGMLETSTHMGFLPGLCKDLLGEDLRMPSVATWWCGQAGPLQYVLDHLDELIIKPAFHRFGQNTVFPSSLNSEKRAELRERIKAHPEQFVAQEQVSLSTAPVYTESGPVARHIVLRVFAAWDGKTYAVMPGGLTRASTEASSPVVSMQMGGGSKDTWVLSGDGEFGVAHRAGIITPGAPRSAAALPSRLADNLFWLGRYTERVESGSRLVRALLPALSGEEDYGSTVSLEGATHLLTELSYLPEELRSASLQQRRRQLESLLSSLVFDPARTSSIGWNLKHLRRVAWQLKERLSQDSWHVLQQLEDVFSQPAPSNPEARMITAATALDRAVVILSAFAGLLAESTTRGMGWRFLELGKRLERALQLSELLRAGLSRAPFDDEPLLGTLLQVTDSSITYRTRYFTTFQTEYVLDLLVGDAANPRSLSFQIAAVLEHLSHLPRDPKTTGPAAHQRLAEAALAAIRSNTSEDLAARDFEGNLASLDTFLASFTGNLHDISDAIAARHFSHLHTARLNPS